MSSDEGSGDSESDVRIRSLPSPFLIVGLGASAGGLSALQEFFRHVPEQSGMAFVVVTHQHPDQPSLLPELLQHAAGVPVVEVSGPTLVEPDHVYLALPGDALDISGGVLSPGVLAHPAPPHMVIDHFFRALARDQKDRSVGIVLSGTGSDGTLGLEEIKAACGLVLVQDEQSAQYAGMPHSAIATRMVDDVLLVSEMPARLADYAASRAAVLRSETSEEVMHQIFGLIRSRTGHDFSRYKDTTVRRRIERRMNVHHLDTIEQYVARLREDPGEVELLFKELLIGVTSFFRDPEAFEVLSAAVGELVARLPEEHVFRVWVPGCSTGEEAYSLAILLRECMEGLHRTFEVQIFATDLDVDAIETARLGQYPAGIASDVSPERLERFFTREEDAFRIKKEIREMLVFAPQNLITEPPFTKLDLISCRNLLIYLEGDLQQRLIPLFHYALRPQGLLFLGSSESIGNFTSLFKSVDKKWKVFERQESTHAAYIAEFSAAVSDGRTLPSEAVLAVRAVPPQGIVQLTERLLMDDLVPPTVLIRERGDVVHIHGRTGRFLEPAPGPQTTINVFNMAREGLQVPLSTIIREAAGTSEEVVRRGIRVKNNGSAISVDLRARRIEVPERLKGLLRVSFDNVRPWAEVELPAELGLEPRRVVELERELRHTKESHQATIEELETTNEELKSTNEELQSTNEELQSTNEELETSKEEMQSLNEELHTVNAELHSKVEQLSRANNDMKNLLNGTNIATVFLDNELNIKRYTEQARNVIRLIPSDIGRPIGDLVSTLRYDGLVDDAREVLRTLVFKEIEVQGGDDWYLMRILPYRTTDNVIDGLVLTFVDITKIRALQEDQQALIEALRTAPTSVFGQDRELRFLWMYGAAFGRSADELIGRTDADVFSPSVASALIALKQEVLAEGVTVQRRMLLESDGEAHTWDLYIRPRRNHSGRVVGITCVVTDLGARGGGRD